MRLRLLKIHDLLADSFWFLPIVMACAAATAALGIVALDHAIGASWVKNIGWVWSGGPDGARSVLAVIAGSIMTVVSIVFSLTLTALAQTSSHYGPRVLRNFTSDRGVQLTLGTFIATFLYCLLVLRTVRSVQEAEFVPYLAVTIGVVLALVSLVVLIFFIHHISQSIQAENLIAAVGRDFQKSLPILFPQPPKGTTADDISLSPNWELATKVVSKENGYLQRVDEAQLMSLAMKGDMQIRLKKRPGDFVAREESIFELSLPEKASDRLADSLRACLSLGVHRTPHQDPLYSLQQLVEIAVHALSPGINEPFTALVCIDWLGTSLRGIVERTRFPSHLRDSNGKIRIMVRSLSFDEVAGTALDQIRLYGANNPEVMTKLLQMIAELAPCLKDKIDRAALTRQARLIGKDAFQIKNEDDQKAVGATLEKALQALAAQPPSGETIS